METLTPTLSALDRATEAELETHFFRPGNMPPLTRAVQSHAVSRFGDPFTMDQLVAEFRAIRASVLEQGALGPGPMQRWEG